MLILAMYILLTVFVGYVAWGIFKEIFFKTSTTPGLICASPEVECGGECVDTSTDSRYCKNPNSSVQCGINCNAGNSTGYECLDGECYCPINDTGSCSCSGKDCSSEYQTCTRVGSSYLCRCANDPSGNDYCENGGIGICTDKQTDLSNCGTCDDICQATNAGCCDGVCKNLDIDTNNCAACGAICGFGTTPACCTALCVDLSNDVSNCGACDADCSQFIDPGCCSGQCTSFAADATCGSCTNDCTTNSETCCPDLPDSPAYCSTLDTITDCGACRSPCDPDTEICVNQACISKNPPLF